jgi:hypothetical protein
VEVAGKETRDGNDVNEFKAFLLARYLCSMDAMWRIFGYCTYPASSPPVRIIKVKTPDMVESLLLNGQTSDMLLYFRRPELLRHLTYVQMYTQYVATSSLPKRFAGKVHLTGIEYFELCLPEIPAVKKRYICRRAPTNKPAITRIAMLYPQAGEAFYLRLILKMEAPMSFDEAKSHNSIKFGSFQQAAIAKGYVNADGVELIQLFNELLFISTPAELRGTFCILLMEGFAMHVVWAEKQFKDRMMDDLLSPIHTSGAAAMASVDTDDNSTQEALCRSDLALEEGDDALYAIAENKLLIDLNHRLTRNGGRGIETYGFPAPKFLRSEADRAQETAALDMTRQRNLLSSMPPCNPEQQQIFDNVMELTTQHRNGTHAFVFISGPGGTGKTFLLKRLQAALRAAGKIIGVCASTSLAAQLFEGGQTAHSFFCYPVVDEDDNDEGVPQCRLDDERLELLRRCVVIFWDEFVSNDRSLFETVVALLSSRGVFCLFVCSGDFRQILPIVPHGNKAETIAATVCSSAEWENFTTMHMTLNMRLDALRREMPTVEPDRGLALAEMAYNASIMALAIGQAGGDCEILTEEATQDTQILKISGIEYFTAGDGTRFHAALDWLYPAGFSPEAALQACVLSATNKSGDQWNDRIQNLNNGEEKQYSSHDYLCEVDDDKNLIASMIQERMLNNIVVSGVPNHEIRLKVNDVCLVTRNLLVIGVANNQRVQIVQLRDKCVKVRTLEGDSGTSKVLFIPRIRFKFNTRYGKSYKMIRVQLPLRLAYCMTYNKAQGQTLDKVLLDTTEQPFAHGHAYVALSRVRSRNNIRIYCEEDAVHDGQPTLRNVVYKEIVDIAVAVSPASLARRTN